MKTNSNNNNRLILEINSGRRYQLINTESIQNKPHQILNNKILVMKNIKNYITQNFRTLSIFVVPFVMILTLLTSCGDAPTTGYIPRNYVEANLIVGMPVQKVVLMHSIAMNDSLDNSKGQIKDADVRIISENKEYKLIYQDKPMGYFYPDTNYKVKPNTNYKLSIILKDGTSISAETTSPEQVSWVNGPKKWIYYPKDSLNLPTDPSYSISWTNIPNVNYYLLKVTCLDTIEYGKYLEPVTQEKNRRNNQNFEPVDASTYHDLTRWGGPIPNPNAPLVWMSLKWYGKHRVTIIAPDENLLKWYLQFQRNGDYDSHYSNIKNGIGTFCSSSEVYGDFFILKNIK
ncbi:MAG: DUF4249 family protein [Candidatus Kapabacteria bacterium]|nr:DUF4249 family protein [Candidatus Kapabacteria bacterium]